MQGERYGELKAYMEQCMSDAAHDKEHIWRVLGYALRLAQSEGSVNYDLLITACLLHDIGRAAQFEDPNLSHAAVGADMAARWLKEHGDPPEFCQAVRSAILAHSYRTGNGAAENIEGRILYDADKLDVCGVMGLLRTTSYCDYVGEPYYTAGEDGLVEFTADAEASVVQEYCLKLSRIKDSFYTDAAKKIAEEYSRQLEEAVNALVGEANYARKGLLALPGLLL